MIKILSLFGTRPEAIKMSPVIRKLKDEGDVKSVVCVTAQHRQMLDQVLNIFDIRSDYDLNLMHPNQSLVNITANAISEINSVIACEHPDWILVQGDTTTVMAASIAAFYNKVKIAHLEAGLRSHDKYRPFPEEVNRKITDTLSDLFFAPTELARQNLLSEGVSDASIYVTGNTGIDALHWAMGQEYLWNRCPLNAIPRDKRLVLITAHRRESFGKGLRDLCVAIRELAVRYSKDCHFVYPVHLNPNVQRPVYEILGGVSNVSLLEPLDYLSTVQIMKRSILILTDSGGIQEEAPSLGIPVLVMREITERPEALEAGVACLVGTDREYIIGNVVRLLDNPAEYAKMARVVDIYGDGHAADRIVAALLNRGAIQTSKKTKSYQSE